MGWADTMGTNSLASPGLCTQVVNLIPAFLRIAGDRTHCLCLRNSLHSADWLAK